MDGQQYLNQISSSNRPVKTGKSGKGGILSSKFFIVGMIGLVLLVVVVIIGAILGGNKGGEQDLSVKLKLHLDNTTEVIDEYQQYVKSSELRSYSASLKGVVSNTSADVGAFLEQKYKLKDKNFNKTVVEAAATTRDGLMDELFEAKINGNLDRIYAHKMAYEISLIMTEEAKISKESSNDAFKGSLNDSYESLRVLLDKFDNFSETK